MSTRPGYFLDDPESAPAYAAGEVADHEEVAELINLIDEENRKILADAGEGEYVTVVVATMLSAEEPKNQRGLSAGVNELRGAYLAQRLLNSRRNAAHPVKPSIRLVPANFGGNSEYAVETAERIQELAEDDPTVVAVTGMGQTRDQTFGAAKLLGDDGGEKAIPMVGSVSSGNDFEGRPYFVRVSPSNRREAEALVEFVRERFGDRLPFIVADLSDPYSRDLSHDLLSDLDADGDRPKRLTYEAHPPEGRRAWATRSRPVQKTVRGRRQGGRAPLVLSTGRANELPTLIDRLSEACAKSDVSDAPVVVGGDDLAQLETAEFRDLRGYEDFVDQGGLYYATFALQESHVEELEAMTAGRRDFFDEYAKVEMELKGKAFDPVRTVTSSWPTTRYGWCTRPPPPC